MTSLPKCSAENCEKLVSKAGFTLCLEHWRLENNKINKAKKTDTLNSTQLGEKLGINAKKLNQILSELGWVEKGKKGWLPTSQGKKLQAEGLEYHKTGVPFVTWPEAILTSRILKTAVSEFVGDIDVNKENTLIENSPSEDKAHLGFRDKFKASHRATDGHWVRSRAEMLIDNWLYFSGIAHAYERLLPVEEELYCDFYVPTGKKVYIEYWGLESSSKYLERKNKKQEIYKKYDLNLIELNDEHILNLDDYLPKMLLKFDIVVD